MAYDDIDNQTSERQDQASADAANRGAIYEGEPGVSYLVYVISSEGSAGVQTTFRVRICEMINDLDEGAAFAGDWDDVEAAPREFLATNVGTARPGVSANGNPGTLVIVHKVGERFAFDYSGG